MIDDLMLLSGNDIPFLEAKVNIHQPTIREIAYIGEESFFVGSEFLNFSKNTLDSEDRNNLEDKDDFEILMSIMKDKRPVSQKNTSCAMLLLTLMFPGFQILIGKDCIMLMNADTKEKYYINSSNFDSFKKIIRLIFSLSEKKEYKPINEQARKIAEKIAKGKQKIAEQKGDIQKISILSRYASILALGQKQDINEIMNYTTYQLYDAFQRFELKQNFDIHIKAKIAGAKDLEDVDNWMKDIHS